MALVKWAMIKTISRYLYYYYFDLKDKYATIKLFTILGFKIILLILRQGGIDDLCLYYY